MSARPEPNDVALIRLPFICRALSLPDQRKEGMRPETAAYNQVANPVGDVKKPIDTFDCRHFLKDNRSGKSAPTHICPSPLKYAEQGDDGLSVAECNRDFINLAGFRPMAASERQDEA